MEMKYGSAIPNTPSVVLHLRTHIRAIPVLNQFNTENNSSPKHQISTWTPDQIPELIAGITFKNRGHEPQICDHSLISAVPHWAINTNDEETSEYMRGTAIAT